MTTDIKPPPNLSPTTDPNLETICRLCLQYDAGSINIFQSQLSIPVRIMACASVEIRPGDGLPSLICDKCRYQLEVAYFFRKQSQISNRKLRKHIRLLNLGRKSRVFIKSDNEDDDADEDEQQYEEAKEFIEAEEAKRKAEQDEKNQKWLEEQREQFKIQDTQRLFQEFGMFMQSRTTPAAAVVVKKEQSSASKSQNISPSVKTTVHTQEVKQLEKKTVSPPKAQLQNQPRQRDNTQLKAEAVAENEITSSEQVQEEDAEDQEAQIFGSDDDGMDGDTDNNPGMVIFDEKCNEQDIRYQDDEIIQIDGENEGEMVESQEDDGGASEELVTGTEMDSQDNDADDIDEFIFLADLEETQNVVGESGRASEVESYQIEENGEIQYLKDERVHNTVIHTNPDDNYDTKYVIEDVTTLNVNKFVEAVTLKFDKKKSQKKKPTPSHTNIVELVSNRVSTDDLKIFKCSECPQSFTRANSLMRHRSVHRSGREYCCDYCEKFFSCKSSLDRHIRIHTGEKPFSCDQCGKNFMQKEILKRHMTIHTGQRPHQCPHCPKAFVQKLLMKQHINAVHSEVPQIVKNSCHLCTKSFLHTSGLSRHLLTHRGMIFACAECGRTFNDKSSLRRHSAVHAKGLAKDDLKADSGAANDSSNDYLS